MLALELLTGAIHGGACCSLVLLWLILWSSIFSLWFEKSDSRRKSRTILPAIKQSDKAYRALSLPQHFKPLTIDCADSRSRSMGKRYLHGVYSTWAMEFVEPDRILGASN
jgi:hypothetical protein